MPENVSVVIPAFRSHASIGRALASVHAQTLPPLEVIIVDDASPAEEFDRLQAEVRGFDWSRIGLTILALPENRGPASARNAGWDRARGDYVAFLDSDDAWHPDKLQRQVALMQETGALFSSHVYAANSEMEDAAGFRWLTFRHFLLRNRCSTPTVMVRRDVENRFEEGRRYSEDYQLWLRLARRGPTPQLNAQLARGFKRAWGESGLSSHHGAMFRGQCMNYVSLAKDKSVPALLLPLLLAWSTLRYVRRRLVALSGAALRGSRT